MDSSLSKSAIYKTHSSLMVQRNMAFANYPSVFVALSDPDFEFPSPDDMAMMISKRGELFEVNLLGAFVWELMDGTKTIETISDEVVNIFNIDKETAYSDLAILIENMLELDLGFRVNP
jgi:Coenzyme PQQ synthesis protein D (PqqD)